MGRKSSLGRLRNTAQFGVVQLRHNSCLQHRKSGYTNTADGRCCREVQGLCCHASRAGPSCQAGSARPADRGGQDGTGQGIVQRRAALLLQRPLLLQQPAVRRWTGGAGALRWTRGESSLPGSSKPCRGSTLSPPFHTAWVPHSPVQLPLPRLEGGRLCCLPRPPLLGQLGQAQLEGGGAQLVTVCLVALRQVWVVGQLYVKRRRACRLCSAGKQLASLE